MSQIKRGQTCPYCKYPIESESDLKICPNCKTLHHAKCWQENGGCTTYSYSCQSKKWKLENERIIIEIDDLPADDYGSRIYPSLPDMADSNLIRSKKPSVSNVLWQLAFAGFVGGLITWLLSQQIFSFDYYANLDAYNLVLIEIAFFASVLGGVIGAALSSVEGITSKVPSKLITGLMSGLLIGAVGGFVGAIVSQTLYNSIESMDLENIYSLYAMRGLFWSLVGLFIGVGQGIGAGGGKRLSNGLLGGWIGGFVAGFLFDYFFLIFSSAALSGFISISLFGMSTGIAIGTVQEIRKEAWLKVLEGATTGKEYIIHKDKTVIGSSPHCDIVLIKDNDVAPRHAEILFLNDAYIINAYQGSSGVWFGKRNIKRCQINNREIMRIGRYRLQFFEKS